MLIYGGNYTLLHIRFWRRVSDAARYCSWGASKLATLAQQVAADGRRAGVDQRTLDMKLDIGGSYAREGPYITAVCGWSRLDDLLCSLAKMPMMCEVDHLSDLRNVS